MWCCPSRVSNNECLGSLPPWHPGGHRETGAQCRLPSPAGPSFSSRTATVAGTPCPVGESLAPGYGCAPGDFPLHFPLRVGGPETPEDASTHPSKWGLRARRGSGGPGLTGEGPESPGTGPIETTRPTNRCGLGGDGAKGVNPSPPPLGPSEGPAVSLVYCRNGPRRPSPPRSAGSLHTHLWGVSSEPVRRPVRTPSSLRVLPFRREPPAPTLGPGSKVPTGPTHTPYTSSGPGPKYRRDPPTPRTHPRTRVQSALG